MSVRKEGRAPCLKSSLRQTRTDHFGHANIIKHSNRPYASVEEMDDSLVTNWNERVKPEDTIYHIGDFAFKMRTKAINMVISRLNGHKFLIYGNHDKKEVLRSEGWTWQGFYKRIKVNDQGIILFHYGCRVWDGSHRGTWQLYGHSHGSLPDDPNTKSFDVGVDCHNYAPLHFDEVSKVMENYSFVRVDHHG